MDHAEVVEIAEKLAGILGEHECDSDDQDTAVTEASAALYKAIGALSAADPNEPENVGPALDCLIRSVRAEQGVGFMGVLVSEDISKVFRFTIAGELTEKKVMDVFASAGRHLAASLRDNKKEVTEDAPE